MNTVSIMRKQKVFVVPETTLGVLAYPTDSDLVVCNDLVAIKQAPDKTPSRAIRNTLDVIDNFTNRWTAGEYTLPCYMSPSGSLGTPPVEAVLLESLLGVQTIDPGVSVTYSQQTDFTSFSLFVLTDNVLRFATGVTVSNLSLTSSTSDAFEGVSSGNFLRSGTVGTQEVAVTLASGGSTVEVDNSSPFDTDGKFEVYDESTGTVYDNSGAGYMITGYDDALNTIDFSPVSEAEFTSGFVVRPYLPAGTVTGNPVENRKTSIFIDSVQQNIKTFGLEISCPKVYDDTEITITGFPTVVTPDQRDIMASMTLIMRSDDARYFRDNYESENDASIELIVGDTAGNRVRFVMPRVDLAVPEISASSPTVEMAMSNSKVLGTLGEDSLTVIYD